MCWSMRVTATVTGNLVARVSADLSELLYKLLVSWWVPRPAPAPQPPHELQELPWFQTVDRRTATAILTERGSDGCFLLRPSSKADSVCSLSVWQDGHVFHMSVRRRPDGLLALGRSKPNERCFESARDLVHGYARERLLINSGGRRVHALLQTAAHGSGPG